MIQDKDFCEVIKNIMVDMSKTIKYGNRFWYTGMPKIACNVDRIWYYISGDWSEMTHNMHLLKELFDRALSAGYIIKINILDERRRLIKIISSKFFNTITISSDYGRDSGVRKIYMDRDIKEIETIYHHLQNLESLMLREILLNC